MMTTFDPETGCYTHEMTGDDVVRALRRMLFTKVCDAFAAFQALADEYEWVVVGEGWACAWQAGDAEYSARNSYVESTSARVDAVGGVD